MACPLVNLLSVKLPALSTLICNVIAGKGVRERETTFLYSYDYDYNNGMVIGDVVAYKKYVIHTVIHIQTKTVILI